MRRGMCFLYSLIHPLHYNVGGVYVAFLLSLIGLTPLVVTC